jgi:AraC-like DNA-binding protein/mannose-6-phosphate isomerase-like protein (cupin superfamily)
MIVRNIDYKLYIVVPLLRYNRRKGGAAMLRLEAVQYLEDVQFPFHASAYRIRSSEVIEPHLHDFVEMAYIAEGRGYHSYNGNEYAIGEGDVFIIEPDQVHGYRCPDDTSLLVYNILFQPALLKAEWELLGGVTPFLDFYYVEPFLRNSVHFQTHLKLQSSEQIEMKSQINRLMLEYKEKKLGYRILCKTRLIELFVFLSRCYEQVKRDPVVSADSDELRIRRIGDFIAQQYDQPLTLLQVSRMCGMSQSTFSVKFKEFVGRTFIEYRNEIRIKAAQTKLADTTDKIAHISQEVGFDDLSFFNQQFKAIVGVPPGQYRKQLRANYET